MYRSLRSPCKSPAAALIAGVGAISSSRTEVGGRFNDCKPDGLPTHAKCTAQALNHNGIFVHPGDCVLAAFVIDIEIYSNWNCLEPGKEPPRK